jgi:hypothetical protein
MESANSQARHWRRGTVVVTAAIAMRSMASGRPSRSIRKRVASLRCARRRTALQGDCGWLWNTRYRSSDRRSARSSPNAQTSTSTPGISTTTSASKGPSMPRSTRRARCPRISSFMTGYAKRVLCSRCARPRPAVAAAGRERRAPTDSRGRPSPLRCAAERPARRECPPTRRRARISGSHRRRCALRYHRPHD